MNLLVIGGGGREHAIVRKLKENPEVETIYCLPGNGSIAADAVCVADIGAKDIPAQVAFAKSHDIDFAVVAPDDPLVLGAVDALEAAGIPCFGPEAKAAIIEGSKVFSKNLMKKYGIPTAEYQVFTDAGAAMDYVKTCPLPVVVKADGLALGKGVLIAEDRAAAVAAVETIVLDRAFGNSGSQVVIEEFLTGPEVSVLAFTDGKTVVPMVSSMDHKRAHDHDEGLNTGGMGTVAPNPYYTEDIARTCMDTIFLPTMRAMNAEGRTFRGCLYFGLMLTPNGPKVIEYNCRFGDPETQVVLPLLKSDLLTIMQACRNGTLAETEVKFSDGAACCVIMASDGYPEHYEKGFAITMPAETAAHTYVAGAKLTDGKLLMFKNETHNHPTEIEPFGGAATCIGGCIRDPLSGRAYVHQAMRVTGAGDPRVALDKTLPGKLPQRKLCQTAAAGYSSYGNQIGLATGHVAELYHEGYIAKRLECGAVVAAAPAYNVRRECPAPGDVVILLGGRTGRDGIGGATGSSKSHNLKSLATMASEVQKGNAPEARKIQRLFRNGDVTRIIKRCNDFGAGGVSVAIGDLADGLRIDLDAVRKKYDGLDGTELTVSESQERMAVVVAAGDADAFIRAAKAENLEAYQVAVVTEDARMVMEWNGAVIADLSRAFLNTNGAVKHAGVRVARKDRAPLAQPRFSSLREMASSLRCASRRGLVERFDSTIGAGSILMPYGGRTQRSPAQAMVAVFPVLPGQETDQASVMAWGCDPEQTSTDPYIGAYNAVYTSMAKLVAAGADYKKAYLSFQEFFEKLRTEPERWGKPFAIAPLKTGEVLSTEFQAAGHPVYLFSGADADGVKTAWEALHALARSGKVRAAWAVENGLSEAVMNMSFGNEIGFSAENTAVDWNALYPGAIVAELTENTADAVRLSVTTAEPIVRIGADSAAISELLALKEGVLESVYPSRTAADTAQVPVLSAPTVQRVAPKIGVAVPKVLIPVFPGTNCEYDSARAVRRAGLEPEILVLNNQSAQDVADSISRFAGAARSSQIIFVPGGFSGGDEPDGSAKFITAFFRNPEVRDATMDLLKNRDGLMLGICNGFQALIKLGLVPYGEIIDTDASCPTLTFNTIGRHQSRLVRTRIASNRSPWLAGTQVGDVYTVPISHGEGRFLCSEELVRKLADNGQIITQYVDADGVPGMDVDVNPNGSIWAIEGITSPDGRVLGKMGHAERIGDGLYQNVDGCYDMKLFQSAKKYFDI